jgi:hypothetical protein
LRRSIGHPHAYISLAVKKDDFNPGKHKSNRVRVHVESTDLLLFRKMLSVFKLPIDNTPTEEALCSSN